MNSKEIKRLLVGDQKNFIDFIYYNFLFRIPSQFELEFFELNKISYKNKFILLKKLVDENDSTCISKVAFNRNYSRYKKYPILFSLYLFFLKKKIELKEKKQDLTRIDVLNTLSERERQVFLQLKRHLLA